MNQGISTGMARPSLSHEPGELYVFESDQPGRTCLVMVLRPPAAAPGRAPYSEDVTYRFHMGADRWLRAGITFSVRLAEDRADLSMLGRVSDSLGEMGIALGSSPLGQIAEPAMGYRFWSGAVIDPFFGNLPGFEVFREAANQGVLDMQAFRRPAGDLLAKASTARAIALEVPNGMLPETVYCFAAAERLVKGNWRRTARVAHVLLAHWSLFEGDPEQEAFRIEHLPAEDYRYNERVSRFIEHFSRLGGLQDDPVAYSQQIADRLLPDLVPYRVGSVAACTAHGVNGRKPGDDAFDASLSWLLGASVSDGVSLPAGRIQTKFPFVVPAR